MSGYCSVACQVCESKCQSKGQSNYGCCESPNGQGCSGCMDICMDCQTACEWSSQGCSTSCEKSCQDRCENRCQDTCERNCQSTCEGSCQTAVQKNRTPYSPGRINVPNPVRGGKAFNLSWGSASDPDGNLSGYYLEKSVDNGSYTKIYTGSRTEYQDTVPEGSKTVRYRVRAYDSYGSTSSFTTSDIITVVNNSSPIISGSNYDYGAVTNDFNIQYIITDADAGDVVKVKIVVDDQTTQDFTETSLGVKKDLQVDLSKYELGKHRIEIIAQDKAGTSYTRVYTFEKINTAPKITDTDGSLGEKNTAFSYTYQVSDNEGDPIRVIERVNGEVLRTVNNATQNTDLTLTVTQEMLQRFKINAENTIEIEATDSKGGTSYRRKTFVRTNFAPIISGQDADLGNLEKTLTYKYSVTDVENDEISVEVYLDNKIIQENTKVNANQEYTITIKDFEFLSIAYGRHALKIVASDDKGASSQRLISFTRTAARLIMKLAKPIDTKYDAAKKVFVVPNWTVANGAVAKVEVCNNGNDKNPTWEDATSMSSAGLDFKFKNTTKTAATFGVDIRLTIEKGTSNNRSYIYGIGGAFE